jgi:bacterioferritin-associated ferredoxin
LRGERSALDESGFEMHYQIQPMIVCMCYPASNRDIDAVIDEGARTVEEIGARCRAGIGCGMCQDDLRERLQARGCGSNGATRDCASDLVSLRSR